MVFYRLVRGVIVNWSVIYLLSLVVVVNVYWVIYMHLWWGDSDSS